MAKEKRKANQSKDTSSYSSIFKYLHDVISRVNESKIFAGIMIIILNIASRFVTIKLSKSMESYLKYTFSKQLLIFAIAWMGTRDIYIAFIITILFTLFMDCLFNEDCSVCVLPKDFTNYHLKISKEKEDEEIKKAKLTKKAQEEEVSEEDIQEAKEILEKAEKQKMNKNVEVQPLSINQASFF
jgi:hypothetical protein|tara:strand:- start:750 stop:1301 length:552 start_codon:yes stop_codon:yes gene_type:complete